MQVTTCTSTDKFFSTRYFLPGNTIFASWLDVLEAFERKGPKRAHDIFKRKTKLISSFDEHTTMI